MLQLPIPNDNHNTRMSRSSTRKKPFTFISNMLKKKKMLKFEDITFDKEMNYRARSEPSVSTYSCSHNCKRKKTPSASTLSLTPVQDRRVSDDMEVVRLRLSRNDNPFIQKVLASRESMLDYADDTESDDAILILMAQDLNPHLETDPLTLPQVHEHMVRSPPPAFWPRSPRSSVFNFTNNLDSYQEDNGNSSSTETKPLRLMEGKKKELF